MNGKNKMAIRQTYISQHRTMLILLVLLWVCPIWVNLLFKYNINDENQFDYVNTIAFFCLVSSSGLVNLVRIYYDKFLRLNVKVLRFRLKPYLLLKQLQLVELPMRNPKPKYKSNKFGICLYLVHFISSKVNKSFIASFKSYAKPVPINIKNSEEKVFLEIVKIYMNPSFVIR